MMSLDGLERAERGDGIGRIQRGDTEGEAILSLHDLSVTLDDGMPWSARPKWCRARRAAACGRRIRHRQEHAGARHRRAMAVGRRQRQFPSRPALFMLPQKPYLPSGRLRRAVAYPGAAEDWTIEEIGEALDKVGLAHLKDKVEEDAPWDQTLSGGEKQRLAFARLFLHNPISSCSMKRPWRWMRRARTR